MEDLKECPFCGGKVVVLFDGGHYGSIKCNDCYITFNPCTAEKWNKRTLIPISKIKELIEKQPAAPNLRSEQETINAYLSLKKDLQKLIDETKYD